MLVLDMGNSYIKWAWSDGTGLGPVQRVAHEGSLQALLAFPRWREAGPPDRVAAVSVLDRETNEQLARWVAEHWARSVTFLTARSEGWGVKNAYARADCLGADRWAAVVAARRLWPGRAVAVIDCGTAVTLDVLDARGVHRGGLIMPGLSLMRRALGEGTAALHHDPAGTMGAGDATPALLAAATREAVAGGTWQAVVAGVERLARLAHEALGQTPYLVLTGGGGQGLLSWLDGDYDYRPDLVLQGALVMAAEAP